MNAYRENNKYIAASLDELGHSADVAELASLPAGIILISGKHGSGKTTTLTSFAKEVLDRTGRHAVEVGTADGNPLALTYFKLSDPDYTSISRGSRVQDVESARRYALMETAAILKEKVQVVVFDDIRHVETALIASYLAGAGVLVVASIHNSGEVTDAIKRFTELPGKLTTTPLDSNVVTAVIHQSLTRDGDKVILTSEVFKA